MNWVMLITVAEREADELSNAVRGRRTSTLAYELHKTLTELRRELLNNYQSREEKRA